MIKQRTLWHIIFKTKPLVASGETMDGLFFGSETTRKNWKYIPARQTFLAEPNIGSSIADETWCSIEHVPLVPGRKFRHTDRHVYKSLAYIRMFVRYRSNEMFYIVYIFSLLFSTNCVCQNLDCLCSDVAYTH